MKQSTAHLIQTSRQSRPPASLKLPDGPKMRTAVCLFPEDDPVGEIIPKSVQVRLFGILCAYPQGDNSCSYEDTGHLQERQTRTEEAPQRRAIPVSGSFSGGLVWVERPHRWRATGLGCVRQDHALPFAPGPFSLS